MGVGFLEEWGGVGREGRVGRVGRAGREGREGREERDGKEGRRGEEKRGKRGKGRWRRGKARQDKETPRPTGRKIDTEGRNGKTRNGAEMVKQTNGEICKMAKPTGSAIGTSRKLVKPLLTLKGKMGKAVKRLSRHGRGANGENLKPTGPGIGTGGKMVKQTSALKW